MPPVDDYSSREQTERTCLARLAQMDELLAGMEPQLPDDMKPIGAEARRRVALWLGLLAQGSVDLERLAADMAQLTGMMESLTQRLLLVPWHGHGPHGSRS